MEILDSVHQNPILTDWLIFDGGAAIKFVSIFNYWPRIFKWFFIGWSAYSKNTIPTEFHNFVFLYDYKVFIRVKKLEIILILRHDNEQSAQLIRTKAENSYFRFSKLYYCDIFIEKSIIIVQELKLSNYTISTKFTSGWRGVKQIIRVM